jgi:hypothetical protein
MTRLLMDVLIYNIYLCERLGNYIYYRIVNKLLLLAGFDTVLLGFSLLVKLVKFVLIIKS